MCAEFMIRSSNQKIMRALGAVPAGHTDDDIDWEVHARLFSEAPVVVHEGAGYDIRPMHFSLKPRDVPYPTFNARLLSWDERKNRIVPIHEKPTWKKPIAQSRALVPLTGFIEPIYEGAHAGEMVMFTEKQSKMLFCPSLYEEGVDKKTGEVYEGFALILHTPGDYVLSVGHHRQPVFLEPDDAREWLESSKFTAESATSFLLERRWMPDLESERSRHMAKGWEKRVADSRRKLEHEREFFKKLDATK